MGLVWVFKHVGLAMAAMMLLLVLCKIVYSFWIWPNMVYQKLKRNGLNGPSPSFPLGNISDMVAESKRNKQSSISSSVITHDTHSTVFPSFASWQKSYGKCINLDYIYISCVTNRGFS